MFSTDIREILGRFEARIAPADGLGKGKSPSRWQELMETAIDGGPNAETPYLACTEGYLSLSSSGAPDPALILSALAAPAARPSAAWMSAILDLSDDETGALAEQLRRAMGTGPYPASPRLAPPKAILAKHEPPTQHPNVQPAEGV